MLSNNYYMRILCIKWHHGGRLISYTTLIIFKGLNICHRKYFLRFRIIWLKVKVIILGNNTYIDLRKGKIFNFTPIWGSVLNTDKNHYKRDSFNDIPQLLAEKIINNLQIKDSYYTIIIYPVILNFFLRGIMNHFMFVISMLLHFEQ